MVSTRQASHANAGVSRRAVIGASAAVLTAPLTYHASAQTPKVPQSTAGYQNSPNNGQSCSACMHFAPPSSCALVDGTISPQGWCKLFAKKG
jgi:hypothetical protein